MKHISHHALFLPAWGEKTIWVGYLSCISSSKIWVLGRAGNAQSIPWGTEKNWEIQEGGKRKKPVLWVIKYLCPALNNRGRMFLSAAKPGGRVREKTICSCRGTVAWGKQKCVGKREDQLCNHEFWGQLRVVYHQRASSAKPQPLLCSSESFGESGSAGEVVCQTKEEARREV